MTDDQSIIQLLTETRGVLQELHRLGLPGLDPRLPAEIIEHNLCHPINEHILLLEDVCILEPYMYDGKMIDPIEEAIRLVEANGDDRLLMRGVFQRAEKKNQNGRIYPMDILQRETKALQSAIQDNRLAGELDHPQSAKIRVPPISHLITKLWIPEGSNEIYGELTPTHNRAGRDLFNLITKDKMRLGVSSRGTGTLKETTDGLIVQPNYKMITYDIVADPSTHGAFPNEVSQERQEKEVAESVEDKGNEAVERTAALIELLKRRFGQA